MTSLADSAVVPALKPIQLPPLSRAPLVSILVSNYNYAQFIGETIESVLAQTYPRFELLICDDGSTDESVRVIEAHQARDARIRLLRQENAGQSAGFNTAYAASKGEIVCLLDSDDLYLPQKLERVVDSFHSEPGAGLSVHRVIRVSATRKREGVWPLSASLPTGWWGERLLALGGIVEFLPPTSGLSLRRELAERIFPLRIGYPYTISPDQLIMRLGPILTPLVAVEEALAEYRLHNANNYGPARVSAVRLEKERVLSEHLWGAQWELLGTIDPALPPLLTPISVSPAYLAGCYMHARLVGDPAARAHHRALMTSLERQPRRWLDWFWRFSLWLPRPLFKWATDLLIRQSWLKQLVARMRKLA